jgi:tetratricopeptide (TPR) repeat protein
VVGVVMVRLAGAEDPPALDAGEGRDLEVPSPGIEPPSASTLEERPPPREFEDRAPEAPAVLLQQVRIEGPSVRLVMSGAATPVARVLPAEGGAPTRIYVDVPGASLARSAHVTITGRGIVRRVRTAQFDRGTARVVIELAHAAPYTIATSAHAISIDLPAGSEPAAPAKAAPKATARAKRAPAPAATRTAKAAPAAGPVGVLVPVQPPNGKPEGAAATIAPVPKAEPAAPAEATTSTPTPAEATVPTTAAVQHAEATAPAQVHEEPPLPPAAHTEATQTPAAAHAENARPAHAAAPPPAPAPVAAAAHVEPSTGASPLAAVGDTLFVWPALDSPAYAEPDAAPFRRAIATWQRGLEPEANLPEPHSVATEYLAADAAFLRAAAGKGDLFVVTDAYDRARRRTPDFVDAARAQFMLGAIPLALGLAPEAETAFREAEHDHPTSPLVPYARIGQATALRLRQRPDKARKILDEVLAGATGPVRCHARLEQAAAARTAGDNATATTIFRDLATSCPAELTMPGALRDYASTLAAAGDRAEARRMLAPPRTPRGTAEEAALDLLAGAIAADDGDAEAARTAFLRVLRDDRPATAKAEARLRLALLDAGSDPAKAADAVRALADSPMPPAQRAALIGEAAEGAGKAGHYAEAFALLDKAAALGPEGEAQADGRRMELFGRWIASLDAAGDTVGVLNVYAAYATTVHELAAPEDRLKIAAALDRVGLPERIVPLLDDRRWEGRADVRVVLAEALLASGETDRARAVLARLRSASLSPELAARVRRASTHAALAAGDVDAAIVALGTAPDPSLRGEVARALLEAPNGAARALALVDPILHAADAPADALAAAATVASEAENWAVAGDAAARALNGGASGPVRLEAAAVLVRASLARGDATTAASALDTLRTAGDAMIQRAAVATGRAIQLAAGAPSGR